MIRRNTLVVVLALVIGVVLPPARATERQPLPGAEVGFWASQTLAPCAGSLDPAYCPRDLSPYTPAVWSALADTHGALYLNLVYRSDFGPPSPGTSPRGGSAALIRH